MKVQNEIFQSSAEIAFFCLLSLANLPRGKKNMPAISTPQDNLIIYHWLEKKNNYCVLRAALCIFVSLPFGKLQQKFKQRQRQ